jgi:CRISPR-associated protein Cmr3
MSSWRIEPRDPVRFGDGRSLTAAAFPSPSMTLPWPSTLAGFIRHRAGTTAAGWSLTAAAAKAIAVAGPCLLRQSDDGRWSPCFPAPLDAAWHGADGISARRRLVPRPLPAGAVSDLSTLELLGFAQAPGSNPGKAQAGPRFWHWAALERWLVVPPDEQSFQEAELAGIGVKDLDRDRRIHVGIEPGRRTAEEGKLFASDATSFTRRTDTDGSFAVEQFAIGVEVGDLPTGAKLESGVGALGGERRPSLVRPQDEAIFPSIPRQLSDALRNARRLRVVLATPAIFEAGDLPSSTACGGARVYAARVDRPQSVSGWDMASNAPKAVRRMAPAGSVFWLELPEGTDAAAWAAAHWGTSLSDNEQDRLDGFGRIFVGVA